MSTSAADRTPSWEPSDDPNYEAKILELSSIELERLMSLRNGDKIAFLRDPREVHRRLFENFAPEDAPEFAGTYRGTKGTALEYKLVGVEQTGEKGGPSRFVAPERVEAMLACYQSTVDRLIAAQDCTDAAIQYGALVRAFYAFGLVHPFLNGNGHIQRLIFAIGASLLDKVTLQPSWTIHPRPYDRSEAGEAFNKQTDRMQALADVLRPFVQL